eukprot:g6800.t1
MPLQKGKKTNVIRTPSVTVKNNTGKKVNAAKIEPNRPKKVQHKKPRARPGRTVGIRSADVLSINPEEESAVEKETRKCSADLEERLTEITKQEIENASKLSQRLRKRCDYFQAACKQKQANIAKIRQEIAILKQSSQASTGSSLQAQKNKLEDDLVILQEEYDAVVAQSEVFDHMYKRITRDLKSTDKQMIHIQVQLRQVEKKYDETFNKHLKTQQSRDIAVKTAARLEAKLAKGRERQHAELLKIKHVIMESKLQREKIKEYVEKSDPAKKKKGQLGALFVTKQLQASLVGQQIKEESDKMDSLSMAFAKIQNSTGLSDVNEIVQKFLTRDETYESLCKSAESARQQIDELRNEQVELNSKLAELQSGGGALGNRELYKEVDVHERKLNEAQRLYRDSRDRNMRVQVLLEECRSSVLKFLNILDPSTKSEKPSLAKLPESLSVVEARISKMLDLVAASLKNPLAKHGSALKPTEMPSQNTKSPSKSEKVSILATPQADELIFQSIMNAEPDTSPRNVRIAKQKARQGEESAVATIMGYDIPVLADEDWDVNSMKTPSSIYSSSDEDSEDERPLLVKKALDRKQMKKRANKLIEKSKKESAKEKEKTPAVEDKTKRGGHR